METDFSIGQLVCLKVDTARQGPVIEVMPAVAGRNRYRVFHSPSEIREYYQLDSETFMQPCPDQRRQDNRSGLD